MRSQPEALELIQRIMQVRGQSEEARTVNQTTGADFTGATLGNLLDALISGDQIEVLGRSEVTLTGVFMRGRQQGRVFCVAEENEERVRERMQNYGQADQISEIGQVTLPSNAAVLFTTDQAPAAQ